MLILDKLAVGVCAAAVALSLYEVFFDAVDNGTNLTARILLDEKMHSDPKHRPLKTYSRRAMIDVPRTIINKYGYTGTAFKVGDDLWITARHVVNDCKAAYVQPNSESNEDEYVLIDTTFFHPRSDMAAFRFSNNAKPIKIPKLTDPENKSFLRSKAFAIGYPDGFEGNLSVNYLGKAALRIKDYEIIEPVFVWNVKHKRPKTLTSVGGISGGPLFNDNGKIIGSLVAEQVRRGTISTADLHSMNWLIKAMDLKKSQAYVDEPLSVSNIDRVATDFLKQGNVVQVICDT